MSKTVLTVTSDWYMEYLHWCLTTRWMNYQLTHGVERVNFHTINDLRRIINYDLYDVILTRPSLHLKKIVKNAGKVRLILTGKESSRVLESALHKEHYPVRVPCKSWVKKYPHSTCLYFPLVDPVPVIQNLTYPATIGIFSRDEEGISQQHNLNLLCDSRSGWRVVVQNGTHPQASTRPVRFAPKPTEMHRFYQDASIVARFSYGETDALSVFEALYHYKLPVFMSGGAVDDIFAGSGVPHFSAQNEVVGYISDAMKYPKIWIQDRVKHLREVAENHSYFSDDYIYNSWNRFMFTGGNQ